MLDFLLSLLFVVLFELPVLLVDMVGLLPSAPV